MLCIALLNAMQLNAMQLEQSSMFMRVISASRLHRVCTTCPPIPPAPKWSRFGCASLG